MKQESRIIEKRAGKKWIPDPDLTTFDAARIHEHLMHDLIAKKLHACRYITGIKDRTNYDGTRTITVTYDNGVRAVYTIEF